MSNENELSPGDEELARALSQLRPAAASIEFASIALQQLQRCAARQVRTWRIAAALLLCGLVASVTLQSNRAPDVRPLAATTTPDEAPPAPGPESYFALRALVLERGVDAIPDRPAVGSSDAVRLRDVPRAGSLDGV